MDNFDNADKKQFFWKNACLRHSYDLILSELEDHIQKHPKDSLDLINASN